MLDPWRSAGRGRSAFVILALLLGLAVAVGLVAILLAGSAPSLPRAQAGEVTVNLPAEVWGLLLLSPLLVGVAAIILRRLTEGSVRLHHGSVLVTVGVILVFVLLFTYVFGSRGSVDQGTVTVSPGNGGGSTSGPPHSTNNSTSKVNGTTVPGTYVVTIPAWALGLLLGGLVACVAVLALPGTISRLLDRGSRPDRPSPVVRSRVQTALAYAGAAIDRGEDPRETVVRLYNQLLTNITPRVGDVGPLTADEIRVQALASLGVGPAASETLTRVFEEARYSTHPIGASQAGRFRDAIRLAQNDILRGVAA